MELYASENNFNIFYEKKRRELKNLQQLNEFVKPNPYFVYFMFKDTIHVDDYGSIKETLFKFPSMTRVSTNNACFPIQIRSTEELNVKLLSYPSRVLKTKFRAFIYLATT